MTKTELIKFISDNINDKDVLKEIENIVWKSELEIICEQMYINKDLPTKSKKALTNFFVHHKTDIADKKMLIEAIKEGMITTIKEGSYNNISGLVNSKFKQLTNTTLFEDLISLVFSLTDSKDSQGATGTGKGEVLLALLGKNGNLPSKSDVEIAGFGIEVKASNGEIAGFKKVTPHDTKKYLDKHGISSNTVPVNFKELCSLMVKTNEKIAKSFLEDYFCDRVTEVKFKPAIKEGIKNVKFGSSDKELQRTLLDCVGTEIYAAYKKSYGFDFILCFKDSNNPNTKLAIAKNNSDFLKNIKVNGMNMTNGGRPAPLTVNVK